MLATFINDPQSLTDAIPWDIIGGGSAALLVSGLSVYLVRLHSENMREARQDFTGALQRLADDFGDRVATLTTQVIESNNRVERMVSDALRDRGER